MVGDLCFVGFSNVEMGERFREWFGMQLQEEKPIYYLLPSVRWLDEGRKAQPGIAFQTFEELAVLMLKTAKVEFTGITEEERSLFFYEILNRHQHFMSEKELFQKAQAYSDTYGQLKRLGLTVAETPQQLEALKEIFYTYEQEYRDEKRLLDPGNLIMKAIELAASSASFPLSHIVIDGFLDFNPAQYRLIEYMQTESIPYKIYLPAFTTPIITETIATLKKIGTKIPEENPPELSVRCQQPTVTNATTIEEELYSALATIDRLKQTNNHHYSDFGLVLVNETDYLPELMRISQTMQIPVKRPRKKALAETNFLSFLKLSLEKNNLATKWEKLPLIETVAKLFFLSPVQFNEVKDGFIRTDEILQAEINVTIEHTLSFQTKFPEQATHSGYTKLLLTFLEELNLPSIWKKLIADKQFPKLMEVAIEFRAYQRIKDILQKSIESGSQLIAEIEFQQDTFNERLLGKLENELLYLDRSPTDGISVYAFRDVALFKGDHLFVLGLNEGLFPKLQKLKGYFQERYLENYPSPFPLPLTDHFRKLDDAMFGQLTYIANNLYFSYVKGMNPHQPMLASKYIMDEEISESFSSLSRLMDDTYQSEKEYEEKLAFHSGMGRELQQSPPGLQRSVDYLDYLLTGQELVSAEWKDRLQATNRISITGLERYAMCPFRYGLERLLKVKEPLMKQSRIDAIEAGNMVHRIIERIYGDAKGLPFNSLESFFKQESEQVLEGIFESEWELMERIHPEVSALSLKKSKEDWWKKLRRWLAAEKKRFWSNEHLAEMRIFRMEESVQLTFELGSNEVLTLTGKIDRIDIDEHGFVIYDYKTSHKNLDFDKEIPAGVVLQIPLYMMALEHDFRYGKFQSETIKHADVIGGGYISMKDPNARKRNMVWKDKDHRVRFEPNMKVKTNIVRIDSESLKQDYKLHELIETLWRGMFSDFSVKPFSEDACTYCSYKPICRVTTEQQNS